MPTNNFHGIPAGPYTFVAHSWSAMTRRLSSGRHTLTTEVIALTLRNRLVADGVELVEEWDEPDYTSVKCRDPDGYIIEASWEP
jgi:hypothetical protein